MSTGSPSGIVVATTFENRAPYTAETEILFRTLAAYGGRFARARRVACCVGRPDPFVVEVLGDLDVEVREVDAFDPRCPHANKLAMLELSDTGEFVLALDTDIAFAADPGDWFQQRDVVHAKPVDEDPVGLDAWPALFAARGLTIPDERHATDFSGRQTIAYFNSGVLGIPSSVCAPLREAWASHLRWLLDHYDRLPAVFERFRFFTDQFALALALAELDLPVHPLPVELNFPTHQPLGPHLNPDELAPVLLHHHQTLPSGELLPCSHEGANVAIERVNLELRRDPDPDE